MTEAVLAAYRLSDTQLAKRIGATQPTINRIRRGKQKPGYDIGSAIERLYRERPDTAQLTSDAVA